MKIYNYQFQTPGTSATICITIRTADGEDVADDLAYDELAIALREPDWYVEASDVEDF